MKRWFINELQSKMLSYNSCSLTTWRLIFQTSYSIDLWCPGAEPASLEKAATQTAKTWLNTERWLDRETLPTAHHKSINSAQRHKGKTTSILLHNKAEKETWQKSHLSLSSAFKSCFAVWWKVPNFITTIWHCQGCINSWDAKSHSDQHQLCRV